jgi:hypothetical protein
MPNRLRAAVARFWTALWTRGDSIATRAEREDEDRTRAEARARFWTELREGQREAQMRSSKP